MNIKLGLRSAALAAVLFSIAPAALAQDYPPPGGGGPGAGPPMGPQRDARGFWPRYGIYGGVGLGYGQLSYDVCESCDSDAWEGVGFHGNVGWRLNPQLGIFLDADFVAVNPTDGELDVL